MQFRLSGQAIKKSLSQRERAAEGRVRGTARKNCYLRYPSPAAVRPPLPLGEGFLDRPPLLHSFYDRDYSRDPGHTSVFDHCRHYTTPGASFISSSLSSFVSPRFNRVMKLWLALSFSFLFLISTVAPAQIKLPGFLKKLPAAGISENEADQGIKEALSQGVANAVLNLHKTDGFFASSLYKVLLPADARKAETTLRKIGLGGPVDKAILAINRGAEDAVGSASPIFTDAIKEMTLSDALAMVRGDKDAATQYFKQKTLQRLSAAFTPPVQESLDRTNATRYYADLANTFNRLPTSSEKVNPDLTAYVVGKTMDALFDQIAKEEANIRANPLARTTDILKKVFGNRS